MDAISLNSPWFEFVRDGKKIYEGRRKTGKIMSIEKGQVLHVRHYTNPELFPPFQVIVEDILEYKTFKDALETLPITEVLPLEGITVEMGIEIYKQYVSLPTQKQDGIVMLKLSL